LAHRVIEVHELEIPATVGGAGWADFETADNIRFDCEALIYGTRELALTAEEDLPSWHDQDNVPTRMFVARAGGRIVGSASYESEPGDDPRTVWVRVDVLPGHRRRGVGTALARKLDSVAATDGIRKAISYTASPDAPGARIVPPTGYGSVPAENPEVQFLLANGYRLEQVERCSRLALPTPTTASLPVSIARSGTDFALHTWVDHTPEQWLVDMANLRQRMSTEEPSAGLDEPEDLWSVKRLVEHEERQLLSRRTHLTAAVEHLPSGRLIGFTTLSVPAETERAVTQEDTLVLPEQRGHALGMLLKIANLDHLERLYPGHSAIITFNAEENRHMLSVNEALGFVPIGYEGAWRRDLPV
jgi:GNAT superfamily N-acetyltransferase